MKQVIQHIKTGKTDLVDVPVPNLRPGTLLIRTVNNAKGVSVLWQNERGKSPC